MNSVYFSTSLFLSFVFVPGRFCSLKNDTGTPRGGYSEHWNYGTGSTWVPGSGWGWTGGHEHIDPDIDTYVPGVGLSVDPKLFTYLVYGIIGAVLITKLIFGFILPSIWGLTGTDGSWKRRSYKKEQNSKRMDQLTGISRNILSASELQERIGVRH